MPAFDLSKGPQTLARYDVIGQHSPDSPQFITHVALYNGEREEISHDQAIDVAHMRPPLQTDGSISAHAAGCVPLDIDEIRMIEVWIAKVEDEYRQADDKPGFRKQFHIDPPWEDYPRTGVRRYRRYSCAGFILYAHRKVQIDLLDINKEKLPEVSEDTLRRAYRIRNTAHLEDFGIHGNGPWRIVLAGYVLHALDRTPEEIRSGEPYQAMPDDELF